MLESEGIGRDDQFQHLHETERKRLTLEAKVGLELWIGSTDVIRGEKEGLNEGTSNSLALTLVLRSGRPFVCELKGADSNGTLLLSNHHFPLSLFSVQLNSILLFTTFLALDSRFTTRVERSFVPLRSLHLGFSSLSSRFV